MLRKSVWLVVLACVTSLPACSSSDGGSAAGVDIVRSGSQALSINECAMPDPAFSPGKLCDANNPNFDGYRYPGNVAHCARNVSSEEKAQIAAHYGIPRSDYALYEFDHRIPLAAGGSDEIENIWPQPLTQAHVKDKIEEQMYIALRDGTVNQDDAVARLIGFKPGGCGFSAPDPNALSSRVNGEDDDDDDDDDNDPDGTDDAGTGALATP